MDSDRDARGPRPDGPRPQGPRPPVGFAGPRRARGGRHGGACRWFHWGAADLHCCKQCSHFEPSTRFQCLKPIPVRIALKDKANDCAMFSPRVTVAREGTANAPPAPTINSGPPAPRNADDARSAFDRLFKKP
ncbi:MAG: hypothetical protein ABSF62_14675 [Bryobacteraceae bacterium]